MELRLTRSIIRDWRSEDVASLVHHANNRKIWLNLRDSFPNPYTLADGKRWIETAASESPVTSFALEVNRQAVGGIGIMLKGDIFRHSGEIGYWLGEEYWGRGIVTEAVIAMTQYAFSYFDLNRISAGVFEWNPASMRVLQKAGYQFEGIMRKGAIKDGKLINEHIYAILLDESHAAG